MSSVLSEFTFKRLWDIHFLMPLRLIMLSSYRVGLCVLHVILELLNCHVCQRPKSLMNCFRMSVNCQLQCLPVILNLVNFGWHTRLNSPPIIGYLSLFRVRWRIHWKRRRFGPYKLVMHKSMFWIVIIINIIVINCNLPSGS